MEKQYYNKDFPTTIIGAFVEVDSIPEDKKGKMKLLKDKVLPLLYAFEGQQATISVGPTPVEPE